MQRVSPPTVNERLSKMKAVLNTAVRWKLIQSNPMNEIKFVKEPERFPPFFSQSSLQQLLLTIKEKWLKEVITFAILTGLRRGELLNLKWDDVDFARNLIIVRSSPTFKTKGGKIRRVPLNATAVCLLEERLRKDPSCYCFTLNGKQVSRTWLTHKFEKAIYDARSGDDRLHFHSLRHTFASWLVQDGASLYEVQKLLGHSSGRITEMYSHLQPETLHRTVNRISLNLN